MRRLQLLIIMALVTAGAIWVAFYRSHHTSSASVAALLPKDTLALIHLPDFNRSRTEFRNTDIYQLWTEPALQEFMQKPRGKMPRDEELTSILQQCEDLQIKDTFLALIDVEDSAWKMVGGFRFKGSPEKAEQTVAHWKARLSGESAGSNHETIVYQDHQIQTETHGITRIATVQDGEWILFANNPEHLKPLLDRIDHRVNDEIVSLAQDDSFMTASGRMPADYIGLVFARVNRLVERSIPDDANTNELRDQFEIVRRISSICAATSFESGKIRDKIFVEMPKLLEAGDLSRASLPMATKDAFLYASGFLNLTRPISLPAPHGLSGWPGGLQKIIDAMSSNGITLQGWNSAFGSELNWIGEWPASAHWPTLVAILPVKDLANAKNILNIITTADDVTSWRRREKDGVQYFSANSARQLFAFSPTIGLSDRILVAGADAESVELTIKRNAIANSELATSKVFLKAESAVPAGKQGFAYIDPGLIYTRVDATLRPIFFMSAAFLPGIVDTVDLSKLPAPEVITRHLSPIVMSQNYDGRGYIAESIGPITFGETVITVGGLGAMAAIFYQKQLLR